MPKILFVDDEAHLRKLYHEFFTKEGFEVVTAATGREAIQLVQKDNYDLAVLDIEMNEINGLELLKELKTLKSDLPIIINSAYSVYMSDFKSWLAEDYIIKSSDIKPLLTKIRKLVTV
jgi:DNA-binding response OmpR family regulator